MISVNTKKQLLSETQKLAFYTGVWAIDGFDQVGKSTIAKNIAEKLNAGLIEVDRFLVPSNSSYLESLDIENLKKKIEIAKKEKCIVLVEGICILKVLEKIGEKPAKTIYVKSFLNGIWLHKNLIVESPSVEKMRKMREQGQSVAGVYLNYLYDSMVPYHFDFCPHEKADLIVNWQKKN